MTKLKKCGWIEVPPLFGLVALFAVASIGTLQTLLLWQDTVHGRLCFSFCPFWVLSLVTSTLE